MKNYHFDFYLEKSIYILVYYIKSLNSMVLVFEIMLYCFQNHILQNSDIP